MSTIIIQNQFNREIRVETSRTLLKHFQDNRVDWLHSCGGKGRCTSCKVIVVEGLSSLTPLTPAEERYRRENLLQADERLACQAVITGSVLVRVPSDNRLPHVHYSD